MLLYGNICLYTLEVAEGVAMLFCVEVNTLVNDDYSDNFKHAIQTSHHSANAHLTDKTGSNNADENNKRQATI